MNPERKNILIKTGLLLLMVVVAFFGIWGLVKVAPRTLTTVGNLASSITSTLFVPKGTMVVSISKNSVESGEEIFVSFVHENKKDVGQYDFFYECSKKNVSIILIDGDSRKNPKCGEIVVIKNNPFIVTPILSEANSYSDIEFSINYREQDELSSSASGKNIFTVKNGKGSVTPVTATSSNSEKVDTQSSATNKTVQNSTTTEYIRKADLYIKASTTGVIKNGLFVKKDTFDASEIPVVKFIVGNNGNIPSGTWRLKAPLPTSPTQTFTSPLQPSLRPGDIIEFALTLDNLAKSGANTFEITVDSDKSISELSENNNSISVTLNRTGSTVTNQNKANLSGLVVARGFIDRNTGTFYEMSPISQNLRAGVKFKIVNSGGVASGNFMFTAELPTNIDNVYVSPVISSLAPGEEKVFVIGFDYPKNIGSNTVTIRIDSGASVPESDEGDNILKSTIVTY